MTKQDRSILVTRIDGYVSQIRNPDLVSLGGSPCSPVNLEILSRMMESWLFLIEDLMLRQDLPERSRQERMKNFFNAFLSEDVLVTLSFLEDLYMILIEDQCEGPITFKQLLDSRSPGFLDWRGLISPINKEVYQYLECTDKGKKAHFLRSIAQFLRYPRKLELQSIGLEDQALEAYRKTEQELQAICYDEHREILTSLSNIIREWFKDFRIENLKPAHGPGSVAEGSLTLAEKFEVMGTDKTLEVLLRNPSHPQSYLEYFPGPVGTNLERKSRTIFVPKTATKLRTISMEPATLQYIQQGVMYELYGYIKKHRELGVHVKLEDQTQNQIWAQVGSAYHDYGTIDLSHASDSVSWELVRRVFRSSPHLYKWMLGTRSHSTILPNGEELRLKKFAPMGSALCFPTECILFSAVVKYASSKVERVPGRFEPFWCVYGDDIVVHTSIYQDVCYVLEALGFSVNRTKSYCTGEYRESCGKEYYAGVDITPLYYRIPFYKGKPSPSAYGSWCSAANNALLHDLPMLRWYFITKSLRSFSKAGPYFTRSPLESPHLFSLEPTNFHVKKRWNPRYQREEGRFLTVKCRPRRGSETADDTIMYFCKLVEMAKRGAKPRSGHEDELPSPNAIHGCVEIFSSTALPIVPYWRRYPLLATDW